MENKSNRCDSFYLLFKDFSQTIEIISLPSTTEESQKQNPFLIEFVSEAGNNMQRNLLPMGFVISFELTYFNFNIFQEVPTTGQLKVTSKKQLIQMDFYFILSENFELMQFRAKLFISGQMTGAFSMRLSLIFWMVAPEKSLHS